MSLCAKAAEVGDVWNLARPPPVREEVAGCLEPPSVPLQYGAVSVKLKNIETFCRESIYILSSSLFEKFNM